ncbi:hypothetical protein [Diaphorobacter sp.]|uniref:hypothetical protein n=1 Tax=Diaphorobacter sp. TaxID=1934310 RepID=UPI00258F65E3|nr:hypothetical protein [Diaphorobacter sp.]
MWFINEKRQVMEWPKCTQEKRARQRETRPEPTIFGNCDGWDFIVGKKPANQRLHPDRQGTFQGSRKQISTSYSQTTPLIRNKL